MSQTERSGITQFCKRLVFYIEDLETPAGIAASFVITASIFLSAAIFVIQTYPISSQLRPILEVIDRGIIICFAIEYLIRLLGAEKKINFIFDLYSLIDLVAILPFLLGSFNIGFIRVLRWFRILRLIRFLDFKITFLRIQTQDGVIFARILFTLITIIFIFSGLIYQVEHPINPEIFGTFLDAVYFSVVTMTTVGFGDVTPLSEMGRFLTILMILTGVALIPWQIGNLIKQFVKTANQVETICSGCGFPSHDPDALYCKRCGTSLTCSLPSVALKPEL
ncbi:MAG: ion transporter [Microcoleaceae cyanobacterium]